MRASRLRSAALMVLAAASVGILAVGARATTRTQLFAPAADSYVNQNHPNTNYGTNSKLKADGAPILSAYLRFDVQGLSGTVTKAILRLSSSTASTTGYDVRSVPNSIWGETTITYANAPPAAATVTGSSGPFNSGQWIAVDVTALVTGNGLVNLAFTTQSTTTISVNSREATGTLRPQLVVYTTSDLRPANILSPTVSGTAQDGQVLTADPGTWSGTQPIGYAYQWRRCDSTGANCTEIAGATAQTYTVVPADIGATLRVLVTASNDLSGTASSAPTGVVAAAPPVNATPPTVSGLAQAGQTLAASNGTWNGTAPIVYGYRWQGCDSAGANCADIVGATGQTYTLVAADVGTTVRVAVTASNSAGLSTALSAQTGPVAPPPVPPANTSAPTVSGTAQDGQLLTADPGTWSGTQPIGYAYQWRRCDSTGANCTKIAGAGAQTYTLAGSDVGSTVLVEVTASNLGGSGTASSAPTGVVAAAPPVNATPPTVSGLAQAGQTLAASNGTWNGTAPIVYGYRWQGCDSAGANCADIVGATGQTYTLVAADVGTTVRVAVTASNSAGLSTALSAQTALVVAAAVAPTNTSPPTISGTAQAGQNLAASSGTWAGTSPFSYAYQWRRCDTTGANCTNIAGAVAQTYAPVTADVGSTLRVVVTASNSGGSNSALSAQTPTVTAAGSIGYLDQSFSGAGVAPTGSKPESKLWWNDGAWWASLWTTSAQAFHIFKLSTATQSWTDTGAALDERSGTRADALWDGSHLYIASHVFSTCGCSTSSSGYPSRFYRYSYDATAKTYTLDTGFPVQINNTKTETLVIDKDSTGILWATWAQDNRVMISHTQSGDDRTWVTPSVLPVSSGASNLNSDDISSLVAFGGNKIGVMWSNQTDSVMYFAYHIDGTPDSNWTASPAVQLPNYADDHINLKSLQSDASGRVFAITKTSLNDPTTPNPADPIVLLLVYNPATGWSRFPVWKVSNGVTRPILLIDQSHQMLHVFATSSESGGTILEKTSPIGAVSFLTGSGTAFIKDAASNSLNNATTTKQSLTTATGLVILASNDSTGYYWHNYETLP